MTRVIPVSILTPSTALKAGITVLASAVVALLLGYGAAHLGTHNFDLALAVAMLPVVPVLVVRSELAVIAAIAVLPFEISIVGSSAGGLNVTPTDLLLALSLVGVIVQLGVKSGLAERGLNLKPMMQLLLVYLALAFIVTVDHPGFKPVVNIVQRFEIVVVPLLAGALLLNDRLTRRALSLFMIASGILALAWVLPHHNHGQLLGVQKNPAGQFIADAALIALTAFHSKAVRYGAFVLLVVGVFATQSRGALIGLAVGLAVYVVLRAKSPLQLIWRAVPIGLVLVVVFVVLSPTTQARLLGESKQTQFNDKVRSAYAKDARKIIKDHPYFGIGIGNYLAGDPTLKTQTTDPHNVILLEAAEGGVVLLVGLLVLQGGALVLVFRRRNKSPWAIPALCVQASILTHALLDVYWVRGTPVMGWFLIGLSLSAVSLTSGQSEPSSSADESRLGVHRAI